MSNLPLEGGQAHHSDGLPPCSPGLRRLLLEGDNAYSAAHLIAVNPTLREQARALLEVIEEAAQPCGYGDMLFLLDTNADAMGVPTQGALAPRWNPYWTGLQGFPLGSIAHAFTRWKRGDADTKTARVRDFFPRPEQLADLARDHHRQLGQMRHRLRKAMERVSKEAPKADPGRLASKDDFTGLADALKGSRAMGMPINRSQIGDDATEEAI